MSQFAFPPLTITRGESLPFVWDFGPRLSGAVTTLASNEAVTEIDTDELTISAVDINSASVIDRNGRHTVGANQGVTAVVTCPAGVTPGTYVVSVFARDAGGFDIGGRCQINVI